MYFQHTLLPQLRELDGFSGAFLLARDDDGLVELTAHTLWEPSFTATFYFTSSTAGASSPTSSKWHAPLARNGSTSCER